MYSSPSSASIASVKYIKGYNHPDYKSSIPKIFCYPIFSDFLGIFSMISESLKPAAITAFLISFVGHFFVIAFFGSCNSFSQLR